MNFIKRFVTKTYYPEGTCFKVHSQKEKDDLDWIGFNKEQMSYIQDLADTIRISGMDGKISGEDRSKCLTKFWSLMKVSQHS